MDLGEAVKKFFLWHTSYADNPDSHCPSIEWIEFVTQELLERMLPYVRVEIVEEIEDTQAAQQEELHFQTQHELAAVFELTRHMMFDLLFRVSACIHQNVLGYSASTDVPVSYMNSEELEHYGAHCEIVFQSFASVDVRVNRTHTKSHLAAAITRQVHSCLSSWTQKSVVCQYRVPKECTGQFCFSVPSADDNDSLPCAMSMEHSMYSVQTQIPAHCTTIYFTAAHYCESTHQFLVHFSWDTPFPQEPRAGEHHKETCWLDYCKRLCNQTLAAAYHTLTDVDINDEDVQAAAALYEHCDMSEPMLGDKRRRKEEEEEDEEAKKQKL